MIKFFRHIRKSLLNENKTSRYLKYAVGEIVLVVLGILIALQINKWNEYRTERNSEQKVLRAIYSDFEFNKVEILENIKETEQTVTGTKNGLAIFNSDTISNKSFNSLISNMINFSTFHPADGALNDLLNSGRLNIILNDSLKDKLSNWNSLVLDVTEDEVYLRQFIDTYFEPIKLEYISFKYSKFERNCTPLLKDAKFEKIVFNINHLATYQLYLYHKLDKEIDMLLNLLENQLK